MRLATLQSWTTVRTARATQGAIGVLPYAEGEVCDGVLVRVQHHRLNVDLVVPHERRDLETERNVRAGCGICNARNTSGTRKHQQ